MLLFSLSLTKFLATLLIKKKTILAHSRKHQTLESMKQTLVIG